MNKTVLIADDHTLMLEGLTRLLATEFQVVGTAPNGRVLLEEAQRLEPDIVVLDVGMPELNGIETAHRLVKILPSTKIVFVTQQLAPAYLHAAFAAGARAYVSKQSASSELILAIRTALDDRFYVTPHAGTEAARLASLNPKKNPAEMFGASLTPRQREVLQLVAEGKTVREISTVLKISPKTVEFHKNGLMNELGLRTTADLTRYALTNRIIAA
jgi:DNA-binding NarL/FixJ family response regulator